MPGLTLVTALIDLGREQLAAPFQRSFAEYLEHFERLLQVELPMVVYAEPALAGWLWQRRSAHNTRLVPCDRAGLESRPGFARIQQIRQDPGWRGQAAWLAASPQAQLPHYNPLVLSKLPWLCEQSRLDPFGSDSFVWVDAGLARTCPVELLDAGLARKLRPQLRERVCFLAYPYRGAAELHGFAMQGLVQLCGQAVSQVARGGLFGGSPAALQRLQPLYDHWLAQTLTGGLMGTEESLFSLLGVLYPELCALDPITGDGLIGPWLRRRAAHERDPGLAVYLLSYHAPAQLRAWLEACQRAYPELLRQHPVYLLDNSVHAASRRANEQLAQAYGLEIIHQGPNLGICGARQRAAEHFALSDHPYMVHFEDDMLLQAPGGAPCRNGFRTHCPGLFRHARSIAEREGLDFLKLSFSEHFGDAHLDWSWHNLPQAERALQFPGTQLAGLCNRTRFRHTGSCAGIPYATGEVFYSNWPLLFSQRGNRRLFLEPRREAPYEQHWMADALRKQRAGGLHSGVLLASPVLHRRSAGYELGGRREN